MEADDVVHCPCGHVRQRCEYAGNECGRRDAGIVAARLGEHGRGGIRAGVGAAPVFFAQGPDEQAGAAGLLVDERGADFEGPRHGLCHHPLMRSVAFLSHVVEERVDDPQDGSAHGQHS